MASEEGEKYALQALVDEFLVGDICPYVLQGNFSRFANTLKVPQRELDPILKENTQKDERVKAVLLYWLQKKENYTVQNFVDDLKKWKQQGYVDREVLRYIDSRIKYSETTGDPSGPTITATES